MRLIEYNLSYTQACFLNLRLSILLKTVIFNPLSFLRKG